MQEFLICSLTLWALYIYIYFEKLIKILRLINNIMKIRIMKYLLKMKLSLIQNKFKEVEIIFFTIKKIIL